ncbi:MAG: hypothetical protein GX148_01130 [Clostridiales bacterium]|nr:hypothetical protein [Clostridiales bacterium]
MKLVKIISIYVLNLFDLAFTLYFAWLYGNEVELNPVGKWLLENKTFLFLYKIILVGILLAVIYKHRRNRKAVIGSWILFCVFASLNIYHVFLYIYF